MPLASPCLRVQRDAGPRCKVSHGHVPCWLRSGPALRSRCRILPSSMRGPVMHAPYRADQVGSLLRPATLTDARRRFKAGEFDAATLRELEERAIDEAVRRQESVGLRSVTDGEFRRDW